MFFLEISDILMLYLLKSPFYKSFISKTYEHVKLVYSSYNLTLHK